MENSDYYYRKYKKYKMLYKKVGGDDAFWNETKALLEKLILYIKILPKKGVFEDSFENQVGQIQEIITGIDSTLFAPDGSANTKKVAAEKLKILNGESSSILSPSIYKILVGLKREIEILEKSITEDAEEQTNGKKNVELEYKKIGRFTRNRRQKIKEAKQQAENLVILYNKEFNSDKSELNLLKGLEKLTTVLSKSTRMLEKHFVDLSRVGVQAGKTW